MSLPATKYDANNFTFDLQPDGSVANGYHQVYAGAFLLDIIFGGTPVRFTGSSTGSTSLGGRQITVAQVVNQLTVTRKIYLPRDGYFVRYLEVLTNPTSSPITVGVRVTSNMGSSHPIQTSNTNAILSVASPANPDRWVVLDDYIDQDPGVTNSRPATAFGFDGPGAPMRAGAAGFNNSQLSYEWDNVIVPAGGTVTFMHFGAQQSVRSAAQVSIDRIEHLPPEALVGLGAAEIGQIQNFSIAPDGTSSLPPLPALTGNIGGRVLDWDGITPIRWDLLDQFGNPTFRGATVNFNSGSAFFGRTLSITAGADGAFNLNSVFNDTGSSIVLPLGPFTISAVHPRTQVQSPVVARTFPSGQNTLVQDLLFINSSADKAQIVNFRIP